MCWWKLVWELLPRKWRQVRFVWNHLKHTHRTSLLELQTEIRSFSSKFLGWEWLECIFRWCWEFPHCGIIDFSLEDDAKFMNYFLQYQGDCHHCNFQFLFKPLNLTPKGPNSIFCQHSDLGLLTTNGIVMFLLEHLHMWSITFDYMVKKLHDMLFLLLSGWHKYTILVHLVP